MNDRIFSSGADEKLPKPEVSIIRDGESVFKPGMKTYFVGSRDGSDTDEGSYVNNEVHGTGSHVVGGMICTCDTVSVTVPEAVESGGSSSGSSGGSVTVPSGGSVTVPSGGGCSNCPHCICAPVH